MRTFRVPVLIFFAAVFIAGCGGGTSNYLVYTVPSSPTPSGVSSTPSPIVQASAASSSGTATIANNVITMPTAGPYAPTLTFAGGSLPGGVSVTASTTNQAPTGVTPLSRRRDSQSFASDAVLYLGLDFSLSTTATGVVTVATTIPNGVVPSSDNLWLALYDPTQTTPAWQYGIAGPAQLSNGTVSLPIVSGYAFSASKQYWLAIYALPPTYATPIPSPAAIAVSTTALSLSGTGTANAQTFSVTEPNYKGAFQVSSGNIGIATVSPFSAFGPSATFTVTPVSGGTTSITVGDQNGQTATIDVGVTAGTVTVNGGSRS